MGLYISQCKRIGVADEIVRRVQFIDAFADVGHGDSTNWIIDKIDLFIRFSFNEEEYPICLLNMVVFVVCDLSKGANASDESIRGFPFFVQFTISFLASNIF